MGRKHGKPIYPRKIRQGSYITTREAWLKLKQAETRTGRSQSDVITYCLLVAADGLTLERVGRTHDNKPTDTHAS